MPHVTLTIMAGEGPDDLSPVLASGDPKVVALAARAILDRLDCKPLANLAGLVADDDGSQKPALEPWTVRLWTCPFETRLGVRELAEAVNRPRSWVYRHTSLGGDLAPIPHRRLDGLLVFVAGEIREWLEANEEVKVSPLPARRLRAA
jgi:predicted DNA-binding transcriptional regulator AlpA